VSEQDDLLCGVRSSLGLSNNFLFLFPPPRKLRNNMNMRDFNAMDDTFKKIQTRMEKEKVGGVAMPNFYIRILCDVDDFITASLKDKAGFKKLSATNGRALNRMKLQFRKYIKEFTDQMKAFRENPMVSDDEDNDDDDDSSSSSSSDSDSDSDSDPDTEKKKPKEKEKEAPKAKAKAKVSDAPIDSATRFVPTFLSL